MNIPFDSLVKNDEIISKQELMDIISEKNIDLNGEIISSCGSGVTACLLLMALDTYGLKSVKEMTLYDGSWAEYASYKNSPISTTSIL